MKKIHKGLGFRKLSEIAPFLQAIKEGNMNEVLLRQSKVYGLEIAS